MSSYLIHNQGIVVLDQKSCITALADRFGFSLAKADAFIKSIAMIWLPSESVTFARGDYVMLSRDNPQILDRETIVSCKDVVLVDERYWQKSVIELYLENNKEAGD